MTYLMIAPVLTVYSRMRLTMVFHFLRLWGQHDTTLTQVILPTHPVYSLCASRNLRKYVSRSATRVSIIAADIKLPFTIIWAPECTWEISVQHNGTRTYRPLNELSTNEYVRQKPRSFAVQPNCSWKRKGRPILVIQIGWHLEGHYLLEEWTHPG